MRKRILLIEGGTGRDLTVGKAGQLLASVHSGDPITIERIATGHQFIDEVRVLDTALKDVRRRTATTISA